MTDFWAGYAQGQIDGRSSSPSGAGAVIVTLISAAATAATAALVVLYPVSALLAAAAIALVTFLSSALIEIAWHDPTPIYLLDSHWLYFNWIGFALAIVLGVTVAWLSVTRIEFRLRTNENFRLARHLWRVLAAPIALGIALSKTQSETGVTNLGIVLGAIILSVALHFGLWSERFSLSDRWQEQIA